MTMPNPPGRQTVAPGELIASDWGNAVWDQSVVHFTDALQRDSQWPNPPEGAFCYLDSTRSHLTYRDGGWRRMQLEVMPENALAGTESSGNNKIWLLVSTQVVTTNGSGGCSIGFSRPGAALYSLVATPGDDNSMASVSSFDYHTNYCQLLYSRNGAPVANAGVRINFVAVMGD